MRTLLLTVPLLVLAACGSTHPLAGHWHEQKQAGISLNFDDKSDKFLGHGHGTDHSSHDHLRGTYRLEGAALEIQGSWDGTGEAVHWKGTLNGGQIEFRPADKPDFSPVRFVRR